VVVRAGPNRYALEASVRGVIEDMRKTIKGQGGEAVAATAAAARAQNVSLAGRLLDADAVEREWSGILSGIRARMLAVPSRAAQRLPHMTAHDVAEIDREVRDALSEAGEAG
jgi:phage terminase Nu1 subunit (DNA packaging protein)